MDASSLDSLLRSRKVNVNVVAMVLIRGFSMFISLLYVPLLLNTLNSVTYGIWLTLTSLISWISLFDVGLGHGLRNKLSEALAKKDYNLGKELISTAYVVITFFVIVMISLYFSLSSYLNWNTILNTDGIEDTLLTQLVAILVIAFGVQMIMSLVNSILFSLQFPAISSLVSMIGQLLSYILVLILVKIYKIDSLLILGGSIALIPPIILILTTFVLFGLKCKNLKPSVDKFRFNKVREITSLGMKFFILQISVIFIYQTNNLIISRILGPEYVSEYNIAYKYFYLIYTIFSIIITPVWSATTEAYIKKDYNWIRNRIKKTENIFTINLLILTLMIFVSQNVYGVWLGENAIFISRETDIAIGISAIGQMYYGIYGYVINGIGKINLLTSINFILALIYIPLCVVAAKHYGILGVCLAGFFVNILLGTVAKLQCIKLLKETATGIWNR